MPVRLQVIRLKLADGRESVFFGPPVYEIGKDWCGIKSLGFANPVEYDDDMTLRDLWVLTERTSTIN